MDPHTPSPIFPPASVEEVDRLARHAFGGVRPVRGLLHVLAAWRGPAECLVAVRETGELPPSDLRKVLWSLARARCDAWVVEAGDLDGAATRRRGLGSSRASERVFADWRRSRLGKANPTVTLVVAPEGEVDFDHPFFAAGERILMLVGGDPWALESRAADRGVEVVGAAQPSTAQAVGFLRREFGAAGVLLDLPPEALGSLAREPGVDELLLSVCETPQLAVSSEGSWVFPVADLRERFEQQDERFVEGEPATTWSHHHWRRHGLTNS